MATLQLGSPRTRGASVAPKPGPFVRIRASRPVQMVLAVGGLALLGLLAATMALLMELRAREIDDARRSLLNLNALLAESTGRTLESLDLVVQSVLEEMRENKISSPQTLARLRTSRSFHDALKSRASGLPQLEAISVVDASGKLVSFSRSFPIPDVDLSDRPHFQRIRDRPDGGVSISEPVENRTNGAWTVYLARRIASPSGAFLGVVYAGIALDYFEKSYRRLTLGPGTSIALWRQDGMLLVRHPRIAEVGKSFDLPAFRGLTKDSPPVAIDAERSIAGGPMLVARHVVPGFALATTVARTRAEIHEQAWHAVVSLILAAVLLAGAVVAVTAALVRQFWAYEALARAERERAVALADLGELQNQLRQSQKLEVIGQLASGVAHDFNNFLTIILGNLDRLKRRYGAENSDLARYVDGARAGAERAAALSQRLLAFSRRQPFAAQQLLLDDVVASLGDLLQQSLGRRAKLEIDLGAGGTAVHVDRGGLESALLNLVVNARDAMAEGGTVTVATALDPEAPVASLSVTDTGTGMPPEVVKRAFEPFFTTKAVGVGTGLGLAQVADFVRQSEGTVHIETEPGEGCRITLRLPCTRGIAGAALPAPPDRSEPAA